MRKALSFPLTVSDPASWLWAVLFGELAVSAVLPFETALHQYLSDEKQDVIDRLETATKFDADLEGALRTAIQEFKAQYVKDNANALAA